MLLFSVFYLLDCLSQQIDDCFDKIMSDGTHSSLLCNKSDLILNGDQREDVVRCTG